MLKIRCPSCGTKLKIRERFYNRTGKCPRCGQRVRIEPQIVVTAVFPNERTMIHTNDQEAELTEH